MITDQPDNKMIILIEILHWGLPGLITVLSAPEKPTQTDDEKNITQ